MNKVELRPEELSVIAAARAAPAPTEMQRARVRKGLDAKIAAGVAAPLLATSTALATMLKLGASVVVVAAVGSGIVYVAAPRLLHKSGSQAASALPRPATAPAPPPAAQPPAEAPAAPPAADSRATPAHARAAVRRHEASPATSADLAGELGLLTQVSAATKHSDVARADALLRSYDQRYPAGQLAEERAAAGILVHCAAGRVPAARAEARRFLERWPRSPLVARIHDSCAREERAP